MDFWSVYREKTWEKSLVLKNSIVNFRLILLFFLLFIISYSSGASPPGFDPISKKHKPEKIRNWYIIIPLWLPKTKANIEYKTVKIETFDYIEPGENEGDSWLKKFFRSATKVDFFFLTALAFEKKRFTFETQLFGGKVNNSVNFFLSDGRLIKANVWGLISTTRVGYHFLYKSFDNKKWIDTYGIGAYTGVRYNHIHTDASLLNSELLNVSTDWVHPILGLQFEYDISSKFETMFLFDIGGFGLDFSTDHSFQVVATLKYNISRLFLVRLGWKYYNLSHDKVILSEEYKVDLFMSGPTLGLGIRL